MSRTLHRARDELVVGDGREHTRPVVGYYATAVVPCGAREPAEFVEAENVRAQCFTPQTCFIGPPRA